MVYGALVYDKDLVKQVVKYVIDNCNKPVLIEDFDEKPLEDIMTELSDHWNPIEFHTITRGPGVHNADVVCEGEYTPRTGYKLREREVGVTFDTKMFDMHVPFTYILLQTGKGLILQTKY